MTATARTPRVESPAIREYDRFGATAAPYRRRLDGRGMIAPRWRSRAACDTCGSTACRSPSTATSTASRARRTRPRRSASTPAMVAKTLVAELDDGFAFALVPGDRELSLRGLARAAGLALGGARVRARRPAPDRLPIGGISPFGSRTALPVYAVADWLARERVALNGGARGVIIELASADLVRLLSPTPIAGVDSLRHVRARRRPAVAALQRPAHVRAAAARRDDRGRRRRALRHALGLGHVVPPGRALRARGRALGLGAAAALQPGAGRDGVGRALVRRLRRRAHGARATSRTRSRASRPTPRRSTAAGRSRSASAATTRSRSPSCAPRRRCTARSGSCTSMRTTTSGTRTSGAPTTTAPSSSAPARRACSTRPLRAGGHARLALRARRLRRSRASSA